MSDNFIDDVNQFQFTEVAIDYNAAFVALWLLLKILRQYRYTHSSSHYTPSPTATPSLIWCDVGDLNADGSINSVDITYMKRYLCAV